MKTFFKSSPILAFILITFALTFFFWFSPVLINLPKDLAFAGMIIGGCGPLLAGYIITVVNSGARFTIGSKSIFGIVFLGVAIVLFFRLYLSGNALDNVNGKIIGAYGCV